MKVTIFLAEIYFHWDFCLFLVPGSFKKMHTQTIYYIYMCVCVYVYIYREREGETFKMI